MRRPYSLGELQKISPGDRVYVERFFRGENRHGMATWIRAEEGWTCSFKPDSSEHNDFCSSKEYGKTWRVWPEEPFEAERRWAGWPPYTFEETADIKRGHKVWVSYPTKGNILRVALVTAKRVARQRDGIFKFEGGELNFEKYGVTWFLWRRKPTDADLRDALTAGVYAFLKRTTGKVSEEG